MGTRGSARRTSTWAVQRGLALLALAVSGLSCTPEREQPAEEARAQARLVHEQQVAAVHARLVEEHGAILFPPQSFRQKRVFTYHLEQLLIRPDARPTLFDARLDDLTGTGDALVLHLSARLGSNVIDARRLRLRLRCTHDQARTLIDDPPGASPLDLMPLELLKNDYAVVAKVDGVNRRIVNYTYTAQAAEGDAELEVTSPDVFAVTGELVAIHALPAPSMNATVRVSGDVETNEPDVAKWDE